MSERTGIETALAVIERLRERAEKAEAKLRESEQKDAEIAALRETLQTIASRLFHLSDTRSRQIGDMIEAALAAPSPAADALLARLATAEAKKGNSK